MLETPFFALIRIAFQAMRQCTRVLYEMQLSVVEGVPG
jgi:hypothetical protein